MLKHELTRKEAIVKVLEKASTPLSVDEIAKLIKTTGVRQSTGATPEATVGAQIYRSIKSKGAKSPFIKVDKNTFTLNRGINNPGVPVFANSFDGDELSSPIITSFGIFWRRDAVEWKVKAKLLGKQINADISVDFSEQVGIYFLYDGREVIYVGRASDQTLGKRLFQHTTDRLATRWDRFSWFGLRLVSEDGKLGILPATYDSKFLIPVLEALLIEATEPRQNRKAGDDWTDKEYMQLTDPAIHKAKQAALLAQLTAQFNNQNV